MLNDPMGDLFDVKSTPYYEEGYKGDNFARENLDRSSRVTGDMQASAECHCDVITDDDGTTNTYLGGPYGGRYKNMDPDDALAEQAAKMRTAVLRNSVMSIRGLDNIKGYLNANFPDYVKNSNAGSNYFYYTKGSIEYDSNGKFVSVIITGGKTYVDSRYANQGGDGPGPKTQSQQTSTDNSSWWSHLVGPALIGLGQPINYLKPIGMLGSKAGSSIASFTLRKIVPGTLKGTLGETVGGALVRMAGTNGLGAALGRFVPVVGVAWTLGDLQSWGFHYTLDHAPNNQVREEMLTGYSLGL